ncbi:hypothetical protein JKP88DRAFT_241386 [Tribonema minus]|uniref:Uncharacterized protein n=1 Tax=Tribonema minus TaxID=303371 RepID=A0A836CGS1_9STRA|nr:hypothetical protein JKP88DRAFT_241386 [Tribonema minus]
MALNLMLGAWRPENRVPTWWGEATGVLNVASSAASPGCTLKELKTGALPQRPPCRRQHARGHRQRKLQQQQQEKQEARREDQQTCLSISAQYMARGDDGGLSTLPASSIQGAKLQHRGDSIAADDASQDQYCSPPEAIADGSEVVWLPTGILRGTAFYNTRSHRATTAPTTPNHASASPSFTPTAAAELPAAAAPSALLRRPETAARMRARRTHAVAAAIGRAAAAADIFSVAHRAPAAPERKRAVALGFLARRAAAAAAAAAANAELCCCCCHAGSTAAVAAEPSALTYVSCATACTTEAATSVAPEGQASVRFNLKSQPPLPGPAAPVLRHAQRAAVAVADMPGAAVAAAVRHGPAAALAAQQRKAAAAAAAAAEAVPQAAAAAAVAAAHQGRLPQRPPERAGSARMRVISLSLKEQRQHVKTDRTEAAAARAHVGAELVQAEGEGALQSPLRLCT